MENKTQKLPAWIERIKDLNIPYPESDIGKLYAALSIAIEAMESVRKNSCCMPCREAGLVAKKALTRIEKLGER